MKSFGLLIDWTSSQYHREIWRGVHGFCRDQGVNLFTFVSRSSQAPNHWEKMRNQLLELLQKDQFDGFLLNTSSLGVHSDHQQLRHLLAQLAPAPVISIGNDLEGCYGVQVDNRQGFLELLGHLQKTHGYKRFAYAGGPLNSVDGRDRKTLFLEFLASHGLTARGGYILDGDFSSVWGMEAVDRLIPGDHPEFEVLVCADDEIARGVLRALASKNIQVPGDLAVTGFDDISSAAIDALTTVRQPLFEIGWNAAAYLNQMVANEVTGGSVRLPTSAVFRQSCGCEPPAYRITAQPTDQVLGLPFRDFLRTAKPQIFVELGGEGLSDEFSTQLFNDFLKTWESADSGPFFRGIRTILAKMVHQGMDPGLLHYPLSVFLNKIRDSSETADRKLFVENLVHRARILLTEALRAQVDRTETLLFYQQTIFSQLNEGLVLSRNFQEQAEVIRYHLPLLGVHKFQMTLYEDLRRPMETAKMVLTDQGLIPGNGLPYDPKKLFGPGFDQGPEPWAYVAEALFERSSPLGFLLLDSTGNVELLKIFDQLGERISPGIEAIHRIQTLEETVALRTAELKEMALRDEMTGLYNRRGFLTLAEHQLRSNYRRSHHLTLFYGDLDGLKTINDTWGHEAGDAAIRTTARLLQETFRSEDIVARLGGDEFVVLAPSCSPADAMALASRLDQAFTQWEGGRYRISLGWIDIDPKSTKSLSDWMKEADETLYRAKETNRARRVSPTVL